MLNKNFLLILNKINITFITIINLKHDILHILYHPMAL